MAIQTILQFGNPQLRESCIRVEQFDSSEVQQTQRDLRDTLHRLQHIHRRGGGLAAPEIGSALRIIYVHARGRAFHLFNPVIVERSDETVQAWDFCFSAQASFLAEVTRSQRIRVEYQDANGDSHNETFDGYFSELLQHEIDHLNGTLFIDHIDKPAALTMVAEWDRQHTSF